MVGNVADVFWKTAIDFRDFDVSGDFTFQNDINRIIFNHYLTPPPGLVLNFPIPDQITVKTGLGAGNPSFLATDVIVLGGSIFSGTLQAFVDNRSGGYDGFIKPIADIPMTALNPVIASVGLADDRAFLRQMLAGNEVMVFSAGPDGPASNDYAYGAAGDDTIFGYRGDDTLLGDAGKDSIRGGLGNDSLIGGQNGDALLGERGRDRLDGGRAGDGLDGGRGDDTLIGGSGSDTMQGGLGRDTFLFRAGAGDDLIVDWQEGQDRLRFETKVNLDFDISYSGPDAVITFDAGKGFLDMRIIIEDVANNSLQLTQQGNVFFLA